MDLLCNAYSTTGDEYEEKEKHEPPPLKRAKPEYPRTYSRNMSSFRLDQAQKISTEVPIAGRYISKRERALMASAPHAPKADHPSTSLASSRDYGSISDSYVRKDILSSLRNRTDEHMAMPILAVQLRGCPRPLLVIQRL